MTSRGLSSLSQLAYDEHKIFHANPDGCNGLMEKPFESFHLSSDLGLPCHKPLRLLYHKPMLTFYVNQNCGHSLMTLDNSLTPDFPN